MKYYGLTHCIPSFFLPMWKRLLCCRGWHVFDEVSSLEDHYLYCDACGLEVHIKEINEQYLK